MAPDDELIERINAVKAGSDLGNADYQVAQPAFQGVRKFLGKTIRI
jgi:hypothetical protein